ncbi:MAG TPA: EamA family transporter [Polyangiales bacterium]|nr:EamA family transporter [Polyangiales bacterium]
MTGRELGMVLVSALLHAAWNTAAKRNDRPTAFMALLTGFTLVVMLLALPWIPAAPFTGELLPLVLASCALHGLSFYVLSRAYEVGDLSLVYPISRSTPAVVPLFAVLLLGEQLRGFGVGGILLTVAGMWLVHTGGAIKRNALREPAALWAYFMLLVTAAFSLVDKRAMALLSSMPWESPLPRAIAFYLLQTAGAALLFVPYATRKLGARSLLAFGRQHAVMGALAALATLASYALVLEALRTAQVSYVVAVRQCSVLFAVGFAVWALSERPTRARMTGTLGTLAGVVLIALYA